MFQRSVAGELTDGHAAAPTGVDPGQELVDVVDVVPRPVGHHEVERRPVHDGVAPHDRRGVDARRRRGAARSSGQSSCRSGNCGGAAKATRGRPGRPVAVAQVPMGKWQATWWPGAISRSSGTSSAQRASARGQRVRKRQPEGGLIGLGGSPVSGTGVAGRLGVGLHGRRRAAPPCSGAPAPRRAGRRARSRTGDRGTSPPPGRSRSSRRPGRAR